jgi:hypothetical protein
VANERVMLFQDGAEVISELLNEARRALDIREQERDRPDWQRHGAPIV